MTAARRSRRSHLDALGAANRAFMQTLPGRPRGAAAGPHRLRRRAPVQGRDHVAPRRRLGAARRWTRYAPRRRPTLRRRGDAAFDARESPTAGWPTTVLRARAAQARARAGRGLPHRLRGRLRRPPRRRGGRDRRSPPRARSRAGMREGTLPPFIGIRIKSFGEEWKARSARTLDIFLDTLLGETGGRLPDELRRHAAEGHGRRAAADAGAPVRDRSSARHGLRGGHAAAAS